MTGYKGAMTSGRDRSALNPSQRRADLERMSNENFDILVIGGGVTGAGAALDAASRGLNVALIEQRDYASGTSSRSSKLFHGGIRYLEHMNFGLVREALTERNLMVNRLCPYLTEPVSFVYPLKNPLWERVYVGAGVLLYELMARGTRDTLPAHQHLSRTALAGLAPGLDPARHRGGVRYWDVRVDDARHTMTLARTARLHGAAMAPSTRAISIDPVGPVRAVTALDLESGAEIDINTYSIVNAAGVWSDDIQEMAGSTGLNVTASKGIHLVVPNDRIAAETGLILRTKASVLFVIPYEDHWIIGTTDTPWTEGRAHPAASRSDIEYLLQWVNTVLATPLRKDDIVGVYAGLRPLLTGESDVTSKLSREHAVVDNGMGTVSVAGGKYTTYRVMARDAVDVAARYLPDSVKPSRTEDLPLVGAAADRPGYIDPRLWRRYGTLVADIDALIEDDPSLGHPVVEDSPYLGAEFVYAATREGALHLDDFLTRRTRMSIETRHRGTRAVSPVSELVAPHLGWDVETIAREAAHYRARVDAERDSQQQPDDHTADAARMGAADVRTGGSN